MTKPGNKKINKNGGLNLLLSVFFTTLVFGAFLFIKRVAPFGEGILLRNDATSQYFPFLTIFSNNIKNGSSLLYSWSLGGGVNLFALICYYLMSPFSLVALFFNEANMAYGYELIVFLKTLVVGLTSTYYFKEHFKRYDLSVNAFSLIYTFCGFYTAYYYNIMWLDALYMLPLVALGIEKIVAGKKAWLYIFTLAYAVLTSFYMGYMLCIFSALYFVFLLFSKDFTGKNKKDNIKKAVGEASIKTVLLRFFGGSLLAVMLSAITLIPVYSALSYGAVKQIFDPGQKLLFNFFDFIMYMLGGAKTPDIQASTAAVPFVYSGVLSFVLLPFFFFSKKIKLNEKISTLIMLLIFFLSLAVPVLNELWHGVSMPTGLPYRFTYIFSFFVILTAFKAYNNIENIRPWSFFVPVLIFSAALVFVLKKGFADSFGNKYVKYSVFVAGVLILIYFIFTLLFKKGILNKNIAGIAAVFLVLIEIITTQALNFVAGNGNKTKDILKLSGGALVKNFEDKDFYRTEFSSRMIYTSNCGGLEGANTVSQFSSMASNGFSAFQAFMGLPGNISNTYFYKLQTPVYNKLYNIRYIVDNVGAAEQSAYLSGTEKSINGNRAYENKDANATGFVAADFLELYSPNHGTIGNQNTFWKYMTGVKDNCIKNESLRLKEITDASYVDIKQIRSEAEKDTENKDKQAIAKYAEMYNVIGGMFPYKMTGQNLSLTFEYTAEKSAEHFIIIRTDDLSKLDIIRENGKTISLPVGKTTPEHLADIGYIEKGETVRLKFYETQKIFEKLRSLPAYENSTFSGVVFCSISSFDDNVYRQGLENLKKNGELKITEHSDTRLKGSVDAAFDSDLWTSIPLDGGWEVFVDGEVSEIQESNAFGTVVFPIKKGHHEIEMRYTPPGLKEGAFVSAAGIILCLLIFALERVKIKKDELPDEEVLSEKTEDIDKGENNA